MLLLRSLVNALCDRRLDRDGEVHGLIRQLEAEVQTVPQTPGKAA